MAVQENLTALQQPATGLDDRIVVPNGSDGPRGGDRRSPLDRPGNRITPLLAVCGLCGGAGVSTLSYLVARFAIGLAEGHVLVCDTGGTTGGLAPYARVGSP